MSETGAIDIRGTVAKLEQAMAILEPIEETDVPLFDDPVADAWNALDDAVSMLRPWIEEAPRNRTPPRPTNRIATRTARRRSTSRRCGCASSRRCW